MADMGKVNIAISKELHKKFKLYCVKHDLRMNSAVEYAIEQLIKDNPNGYTTESDSKK